MPIRSQLSSVMEQIEPEHPELFVLEFRKIYESVLVRLSNFCKFKGNNSDSSAPIKSISDLI